MVDDWVPKVFRYLHHFLVLNFAAVTFLNRKLFGSEFFAGSFLPSVALNKQTIYAVALQHFQKRLLVFKFTLTRKRRGFFAESG